jgi:glycolate oxidase FAD binding subunit
MGSLSDRLEPLFASALGEDAVTVDADGAPALGVSEAVVRVHPATVDQVGDALRVAVENDIVVVPTGSGASLTQGNIAHDDIILLSTSKLDQTIDYEPRDLTAILQAGKTVAALAEETGAEGQMLALDPPSPSATIGGLVATNGSGVLRHVYGTPRDLCLGTTVVLSDGSVIKCGGRVVKNVAGYDTTRLYVGSMGTLGVVVDASFRLHPVPDRTSVVIGVAGDWIAVGELASRMVAAPVEPRFVELLDLADPQWGAEDTDEFAPAVVVGFGGSAEQVNYQTDYARKTLASGGATDVRADDSDDEWRSRFAAARHDAAGQGKAVVRITGIMTAVLPAMRAVSNLADTRGMDVQWLCHYTSGVVYATLSCPSPSSVADLLGRVRREAAKLGSGAVIESAPADVRRAVDVWGPPDAPLDLMRQLKRRLDPTSTLNRGRFIRGLDG